MSQSDVVSTGDSTLDLQQRTLKALSHPIRMRALIILNDRVASPSEIAAELEESLGVVSYHMRTLERLGCIELVRRAQRRGAVEHYYRAITRPWISDEDVPEMPKSLQRSLAGSIFHHLAQDVTVATQGEGFNRSDYCMIRFPLILDDDGWKELSGLLQAVLDRAVELAGETQNRVIASRDEDGAIPAILGIQLFERRAEEHERQLKSAKSEPKPETVGSITFGDVG